MSNEAKQISVILHTTNQIGNHKWKETRKVIDVGPTTTIEDLYIDYIEPDQHDDTSIEIVTNEQEADDE